MVNVDVVVLCESSRQFLSHIGTASSAYYKAHVVEKATVQSSHEPVGIYWRAAFIYVTHAIGVAFIRGRCLLEGGV